MKHSTRLLLLPLAAAPLALNGQEAPIPEEVFVMDAFEIRAVADEGYRASNVLSAYRVNTTIRETPLNIQVMTEELLRDVSAVSLEQAMTYMSGVNTRATGVEEEGQFTIRGLTASRPKRNGYRRYNVMDMTNVQRIEVIKGPATTLFGEAQPGGVINYITKLPQAQPAYELSVQFGTWNHKRAQVGATGPLLGDSSKLLYRLDASVQDSEGFRDYYFEKRAVVAPVVSWQPTERTRLKLDFEWLYKDFNPPGGNLIWNEAATRAFWDRWVPGGAPADWNDLPQATAAFVDYLRANPSQAVPFLFSASPQAFPTDAQGRTRYTSLYPLAPLSYTTTGPDTFYKYDIKTYSAEALHTFSEAVAVRLNFSASASRQDYQRANTQRVRVFGDMLQQGKRRGFREHDLVSVQGDALLKFDTGRIRHRIIVGGEFLAEEFTFYQIRNNIVGSPNGSNYVILFDETEALNAFRRQSIFPAAGIPFEAIIRGPTPISDADLFNPDGTPVRVEDSQNYKTELVGLYISDQISLFKDKLKLLAGLRWDEYSRPNEREATTTPQLGANWYATSAIVLYANYSESVTPMGGTYLDGEGDRRQRPAEQGEGKEAGVKFSLFDGRVSGTLAWFDISKTNVLRPGGFLPDGQQYLILATGQNSTGVELDLIAYPTPNLQMTFGYAYIDSSEVLENNPDNPLPEDVFIYNKQIVGVPEHQVSLWGKYSFSGDLLKGLDVGLGVSYLGKRRGGQTIDDFLTLDAYTKVDLLVAYRFTHRNVRYRFALNVDNLLDKVYFNPGMHVGNPINAKVTLGMSF